MQFFTIILFMFVFVFRSVAPAPIFVDAPDGIAHITWTNTASADSITVFNVSSACPYPVVTPIDPVAIDVTTQVPEGPPYETRCLLRPGDRLYIQQYRGGQWVQDSGPYVVPMRVFLPSVVR